MQTLNTYNQTIEKRARKKYDRRNGTSAGVETTTTLDDVNDVNISVAGSGVVYDSSRPNKSTSGTSECSHGGHDRCICGMDESRG